MWSQLLQRRAMPDKFLSETLVGDIVATKCGHFPPRALCFPERARALPNVTAPWSPSP